MAKGSKSRVARVPVEELEAAGLKQTSLWLQDLQDKSFRSTKTFFVTFTDSFTVSSVKVQTRTKPVVGVMPDDSVTVSSNEELKGQVSLIQTWVSATDVVAFRFLNTAGGNQQVPPVIYKVQATRF